MIKKILPLLLLALSYWLFAADAALAQDDVNVPVASAESILDEAKKKILKKALDKNLNQTEKVLSEQSSRLVGYAGTVNDIKQGVFTLESLDATLQVSFDATTVIIKNNQPLKPELITLKDRAIVIGQLTAPDIITAKRIITYKENPAKTNKKIFFSPLVKIQSNSLIFRIDNQVLEVALGQKLKIDPKQLRPNQKIFGIILTGSNGAATLIQAKVIE